MSTRRSILIRGTKVLITKRMREGREPPSSCAAWENSKPQKGAVLSCQELSKSSSFARCQPAGHALGAPAGQSLRLPELPRPRGFSLAVSTDSVDHYCRRVQGQERHWSHSPWAGASPLIWSVGSQLWWSYALLCVMVPAMPAAAMLAWVTLSGLSQWLCPLSLQLLRTWVWGHPFCLYVCRASCRCHSPLGLLLFHCPYQAQDAPRGLFQEYFSSGLPPR